MCIQRLAFETSSLSCRTRLDLRNAEGESGREGLEELESNLVWGWLVPSLLPGRSWNFRGLLGPGTENVGHLSAAFCVQLRKSPRRLGVGLETGRCVGPIAPWLWVGCQLHPLDSYDRFSFWPRPPAVLMETAGIGGSLPCFSAFRMHFPTMGRLWVSQSSRAAKLRDVRCSV